MSRFVRYALFVLSLVFLLATWPANRTESDYGFEWARMAEAGGPVLLQPFNLLYPVLARTLYAPLQAVGWPWRAYPLLCFFSALCGAGTVVVFARFCYRRYSMRPASSLIAALLLLFSYGFWRYSTEASATVPAILLIFLALYHATDASARTSHAVVAAAFAAAGSCLHIVNLAPALIGIPGYFLVRRDRRGFLAYTATLLLLLGVVGALLTTSPQAVYFRGRMRLPGLPALGAPLALKAAVGFGQSLVSANFLMRFDWARHLLDRMFPYRMLGEEFYMGTHAPSPAPWFPFLTLTLIGVLALAGLATAAGLRRARRDGIGVSEQPFAPVVGGRSVIVAVTLWFVVCAGTVILFEPGNPEGWVMALPSFWLVVCALVIVPLGGQQKLWLPAALAVTLFLHNEIGGMRMLRSRSGDYDAQKVSWLVRHVTPKDRVLTAGDPVFVRYLSYQLPENTVVDVRTLKPERLATALAGKDALSGHVFAVGDVFEQPSSLRYRFPESYTQIEQAASAARSRYAPVATNEFGGVFELERPRSSD